jgi:hypothetical protein
MKTGKVADMLGLDHKTVTNWTDRPEFQPYFSQEALGKGRSVSRSYNEQDVIVLNTIRTERQKNTDWPDIGKLLAEGVRDTDLPPSALLVDSPAPLVQYGKIQALQTRVDELEVLLRQKDDIIREKDDRIGDLREEIGVLKGIIKMMEKQAGQSDGTKGQ